ncbi:MAG: beta-ketoacyl synthase N-terminal-like domain-containing protein, partial [Synechococcaceae cyanobacterium]|nr:beta-ketoacyl synthase N-terminal-like domain-containing protein [Synechococcaceae cyanobacterium]
SMGVAGFGAIRALSTRNEDPEGASRPFDRDRDGFVLSEGAAILVLEEMTHARERGTRIYGELVGYGATGDAYHLTAPAPNHEGGRRCMRMALAEAGMRPEEVGYINAHATATEIGDKLEAEAIQAVFGESGPPPPVSATKSMTGHMTGAGGAAEAAFALLAMGDGVIPPTTNLVHLEEGITLDCVPNRAREARLEAVMSNAFGFGGTNVSLIFRKV